MQIRRYPLTLSGLVLCSSAISVGCFYDDSQTTVPPSFNLSSTTYKVKPSSTPECDTKTLNTPLAHQNCLRTISDRAKKLADDFYLKAHSAKGLKSDTTDKRGLAEAWQNHYPNPTSDEIQTIRTLGNFEVPCSGVLAQTVRDPASPLRFSHTTGYGVARYCLQSAMRIAKQAGLNFDFKTAAELLETIDTLYDHYDQHPIGEGKPAYGSQNPF